jgi:sugar-specific transcriptional regulator TrmB
MGCNLTENAVVEYMPVLKANLGLTDLEAKVMLPIYLGGNMTPGAIAMISGEKLPSVNRTLGRLESKGFVVKVEGVVPIFRPVPAVLSMTGELNSVVENIEGLAHASLSALEIRYNKLSRRPLRLGTFKVPQVSVQGQS